MSIEAFQIAKDSLIPRDIYLRNANLHLADDFEPKYFNGPLVLQHKRSIVRAEYATTSASEQSNEKIKLFRVIMELGMRQALPEATEIADPESEEAEQLVKVELVTQYVAEYEMTRDDIEEEGLQMFAEQNVIYHIWPFWREYALNMCQRANLSKVVMPTFQVDPPAKKPD